MALMPAAELERLKGERLQELEGLRAEGRKVVGYFCLYAPVELMAASGVVPVRLMSSSAEAESAGERFLRLDACSFCRSCLGSFAVDPLFRLVDGVVSVTTCDMMRRLPEAIAAHRGVPVFQLYLPRTSEPEPERLAEFRRQLKILGTELAGLTGRLFDEDGLRQAVCSQNRLRTAIRRVDEVRASAPPPASGSDVLDSVALAGLLDPAVAAAAIEKGLAEAEPARSTGARPRLMLGGSIVTVNDRWLVEMVEERADLVADIVCTGARWAAEDVAADAAPLDALARFYFGRLPCMCRRPNNGLYEHARKLVADRRVAGLVYKTLLYCDAWSFEARRLHEELGIPVLAVDSDYSGQNREQVRTRIEAFLETAGE